jgi:hypothetical protein
MINLYITKCYSINQYRYISLFLYPHLKFDFNVWHEWDPPMSTKQNNYQWHGEDIAENGTENQTKTNTSYTFLSFYHHLQCASRVSLSFPVSTFSFTSSTSFKLLLPLVLILFLIHSFCLYYTLCFVCIFKLTFLILRWFVSFYLSVFYALKN